MSERMKQQEKRIAALEACCRHRDEQIKTLHAISNEKDQRIAALEENERLRVAQVFKLQEQLAESEAELLSLLDSEGLLENALEMVRDADNDCRADGLPTIPPMARATIDAALEQEVADDVADFNAGDFYK